VLAYGRAGQTASIETEVNAKISIVDMTGVAPFVGHGWKSKKRGAKQILFVHMQPYKHDKCKDHIFLTNIEGRHGGQPLDLRRGFAL
jgi:hypothetical protein